MSSLRSLAYVLQSTTSEGLLALSYLKRLPVDALKIDRSFVDDLLSTATDSAIVAAVAAMARALAADDNAEGVETSTSCARCAGSAATWSGYFFTTPQPPAHISRLLESDRLTPMSLRRTRDRALPRTPTG